MGVGSGPPCAGHCWPHLHKGLLSPAQDTLNNNSLGKKHSWQDRVSRSSSPLKTGKPGPFSSLSWSLAYPAQCQLLGVDPGASTCPVEVGTHQHRAPDTNPARTEGRYCERVAQSLPRARGQTALLRLWVDTPWVIGRSLGDLLEIPTLP